MYGRQINYVTAFGLERLLPFLFKLTGGYHPDGGFERRSGKLGIDW